MGGTTYFDGSETNTGQPYEYAVPVFDMMIQYIQSKGIKIVSLSDTNLNLDVI